MGRFSYLLAFVAAAWLLGYGAFALYVKGFSAPDTLRGDIAVVWTGGGERVNAGLEALDRGAAGHLFISGVERGVLPQTLLLLWRQDDSKAHLRGQMTLGYRAQDTHGNAVETAHWLRDYWAQARAPQLVFITADYHMPRAMLEMRAAVPSAAITPLPVRGDGADWQGVNYWQLLFKEYHKWIWTWIRLQT